MTLSLDNLGGIRDPAIRRNFEIIAQQFPIVTTGGGGGGAETDPVASPALATHAALTTTAHGGIVASTDPRLTDARTPTAHKVSHEPGGTDALTGLTNASIAAGAGIAKTKLASLDVVNADVNAAAAIARAKLDFGSGLVNADISATAAIAKTKLANLDVVNADVNAAAAIAESKLNLATDAAAGTGSRRTLGTTATSAAAGNRGQPTGGTTGQVLTKNTATDYDSGWTTPATGGTPTATGAFSAYRSTAVSNATATVVVYNTELFDVSSWFNNTTGIYTPLTAGYYLLSAGVWANTALTASAWWQCRLQKNGTDLHAGNVEYQAGTVQTPLTTGSWVVQANGSTDNFKITISHNQGVAVALAVGTVGTFFQGHLIGT